MNVAHHERHQIFDRPRRVASGCRFAPRSPSKPRMRKSPQRVGKSASATFFTLSNPIPSFYGCVICGRRLARRPRGMTKQGHLVDNSVTVRRCAGEFDSAARRNVRLERWAGRWNHLADSGLLRAMNRCAAVRALLKEYWDSFGFTPCFQNFGDELAGLPGAYAPPGGRLALATIDGQPAGCIALAPRGCESRRGQAPLRSPGISRLGLGRALLEWVMTEARAAGYCGDRGRHDACDARCAWRSTTAWASNARRRGARPIIAVPQARGADPDPHQIVGCFHLL